MPIVDAYRRAPLVNPAFVPFSDGAVQAGGIHGKMTARVLAGADVSAMTPLDAVLASKLGGYADLPPVPNVAAAATELRSNPRGFVLLARAALMTASANRDKEALLQLLDSMRLFLEAMPEIPQEKLFPLGADALRLVSDLYRRTGAPFLLTLLECLRVQLPDVTGILQSFPFLKAYESQNKAGMEGDTLRYHENMDAAATGSLMGDALAMTVYLALYSGSSREGTAGKAGLAALMRYHGAPTGAFTADPYLAGRDPARATDLAALCSQIEALSDLLMASGDLRYAEQLEMLMMNALPELLPGEGIRTLQPMNRLWEDDSCTAVKPEPRDTSALLRALYALRRSIWLAKENTEIALLLPVDGGCLTRVSGVPVRLTAQAAGVVERRVTIAVETRQPVNFTLKVRVPAYGSAASFCVNGGKEENALAGEMLSIGRTFQNGDVITVKWRCFPKWETGYRGSRFVTFGAQVMALPLADKGQGWQFALLADGELIPGEEMGKPCVRAVATDAPAWSAKNGFVTPPPQGLYVDQEYELTLLPFAETTGRIVEFPCAAVRP